MREHTIERDYATRWRGLCQLRTGGWGIATQRRFNATGVSGDPTRNLRRYPLTRATIVHDGRPQSPLQRADKMQAKKLKSSFSPLPQPVHAPPQPLCPPLWLHWILQRVHVSAKVWLQLIVVVVGQRAELVRAAVGPLAGRAWECAVVLKVGAVGVPVRELMVDGPVAQDDRQ